MDKIKDKKKNLLKYILKNYLHEIRSLLKANKSQSQEILIEKLSSLIRKWWFIFNSPPFYNCFIPRSFFPSLLPCISLKLYACVFFSYSFYFPLLKNDQIRFVKKKKSWFSGLGTSLVLFPKSSSSRAETSFTRFFLEPALFLKGATLNPDSIIGRKNNTGSLDPFFLELGGCFIKEPIQLRTNILKLKKEGIKKKVLSKTLYKKEEEEKNQWEVLLALPFFTNKLKWLNVLYVLPTGFLFFSFLPLSPRISVAHKGLFCPFLFLKKPLLLKKTLFQTATSFFCNNQKVLEKVKKQSFLEKKTKKRLSFSYPLKIKKLLFFLRWLRPRLYNPPSFLRKKRKSTRKAFLGFRVSSDLSSFDFFTNVQNQNKNIEKEKSSCFLRFLRREKKARNKKKNKEKIDALYRFFIRGEAFPLPFSSHVLVLLLATQNRWLFPVPCFSLLASRSLLLAPRKKERRGKESKKKQPNQTAKKFPKKNNQENNKKIEEKRNIQISENHFSLFLKKKKNYSDATLLKIVWKWTYKRHSKKSNKWIIKQYFVKLNGQNRVFAVLLLRNKSQKRTIKKLASYKKKDFISLPLLLLFDVLRRTPSFASFPLPELAVSSKHSKEGKGQREARDRKQNQRERKQPLLFFSNWKRVKRLSQQKLNISTSDGNSNKPVINDQGRNKSFFFKTQKYPWPIEKKFPILKTNLLKNVYKKGTFCITLLKKKSFLRFFFHFLRIKKNGLIRKRKRKQNLLRSKFFSKVKKKGKNNGKNNGPKNKKFFCSFYSVAREFFPFIFSKTKKKNIIGKSKAKKREVREVQLRKIKTTLHYFNNSKTLFFRNLKIKKKPRFNLFFTIPTYRELDITYHKNIKKKYSRKKICDQSNDFLYWSYQKTKIRSL